MIKKISSLGEISVPSLGTYIQSLGTYIQRRLIENTLKEKEIMKEG